MCEVIAQHWKRDFDIDIEPERIFNYSPRGELYWVYVWYEAACLALGLQLFATQLQSPDPAE
jgi:hypothetical protein